jgi:hypothetical protein
VCKTTKVKIIVAKGKLGERKNYKHITPVLTSLIIMGIWKVTV